MFLNTYGMLLISRLCILAVTDFTGAEVVILKAEATKTINAAHTRFNYLRVSTILKVKKSRLKPSSEHMPDQTLFDKITPATLC